MFTWNTGSHESQAIQPHEIKKIQQTRRQLCGIFSADVHLAFAEERNIQVHGQLHWCTFFS